MSKVYSVNFSEYLCQRHEVASCKVFQSPSFCSSSMGEILLPLTPQLPSAQMQTHLSTS